MKKVGVLFNPIKDGLDDKAKELCEFLKARGLETWVSPTATENDAWSLVEEDSDMVVVFGGDGTFLTTARYLCPKGIPILGIKHGGHLGFLSEPGNLDLERLASYIADEEIIIEERSMLQAYLPDTNQTLNALNDIVISRSHHINLLQTDLYIDEELLASYRSDGLIICTPTGSTAYALSAGGAVMDPNISAFQIVPTAAHTLTSRPHVISDNQTIVLISKDERSFFMQADGQDLLELKPGSKIIINKSNYTLKHVLLKSAKRKFYNVLRDKFHWGFSV